MISDTICTKTVEWSSTNRVSFSSWCSSDPRRASISLRKAQKLNHKFCVFPFAEDWAGWCCYLGSWYPRLTCRSPLTHVTLKTEPAGIYLPSSVIESLIGQQRCYDTHWDPLDATWSDITRCSTGSLLIKMYCYNHVTRSYAVQWGFYGQSINQPPGGM